jgi:hypothetical protein
MSSHPYPATCHLGLPPATRNVTMKELPYLHLNTRTRDLMAETWDLKVFLPQPIIRSPVSL